MDLLVYPKYAALHPKSNGLARRKKSCALRLVEKGVRYGWKSKEPFCSGEQILYFLGKLLFWL